MEFEFDKEIDAILRKARGSEAVISFDSHLDADEIAAFAENAVTERARARYTAHFADCARCRKLLSNVILLNSDAATETVSSTVPATVEETKIPWYRKLFVFPQLAYTMGGLVLLFSGFFGYVILQNISGTQNSEVSKAVEAPSQMEKSAPSAANANSSSMSNTTTATVSNSTVTTTANTASNSAATMNQPSLQSSNTIAAPSLPSDKKVVTGETENKLADTMPMATPAPKPELRTEKSDDQPLLKPAPSTAINQSNAAGASREENKRDKNERQNENAFILDGQDARKDADDEVMKTRRATPQPAKKKENEAGATRSVGGKTFNNVGGIWFDSAVGKQKQKTVRRGTSEYQKLDSNLRSIAEQLGGTVVILWNGKAYRIQ